MSLQIKIDPPKDSRALPVALNFFGVTKMGKSIEVAKAFGDYLWITTSPTVLAPYYDWIAGNREEAAALGCKFPVACVSLPEFDGADITKPVMVRKWMTDFLSEWSRACSKDETEFGGIVIDEFSTFDSRLWPQILKAAGGKSHMYPAMDELLAYYRWLVSIPRTPWGRDLITISHKSEAKYDTEEGSPTRGKFRHPGGPQFALGQLVRNVCQEFDGVFELTVEESFGGTGKRQWRTDGSDTMYRGFRRFTIGGEPLKPIEPLGLPYRIRKDLDAIRAASRK